MSVDERLPTGWALANLEEIVEILDGARVPVNARQRATRRGDIPYYGATGQVGWIDDYIFNEELVLLGEDGAPFFDKTRHVAYVVNGKSWVNNHAHVLRARRGIDSNLIANQLNATDYRQHVSGTTRWKLNQAPMRRIRLKVPPVLEQTRISDSLDELLSDLNAGVLALERVRAKLALYRASVLKAAVDGTLTADWRAEHPNTEPAAKLLERIPVERRRRWEEEQLRKFKGNGQEPPKNWKAKYKEPMPAETNRLPSLPHGWCWASVDQCAVTIQYGTSAKCTRVGTGVPILRMGNIASDGRLSFVDLRYLPLTHAEFPELLLQSGDILFNRTNSAELVGKTAHYVGTPAPCSFASYLIRVRLVAGVRPQYLVYSINSGLGRSWIKAVANQTVGQANVNGTKLAAFAFPLAPSVEQNAIVEAADDQISVIDYLETELDAKLKSAQGLRQAILRHAFTGQLVPQDPNDEPASELLKRIAAGRKSRATEAAAKKAGAQTRAPKAATRPRPRPKKSQASAH